MDALSSIDPAITVYSVLGAVISYLFYGFALTSIFRKAGLKAWPAWVPIFLSPGRPSHPRAARINHCWSRYPSSGASMYSATSTVSTVWSSGIGGSMCRKRLLGSLFSCSMARS